MTVKTARTFALMCSLACAICAPALAQSKHGARDYGASATSKSEQSHDSARLKSTRARDASSARSKSQGRNENRGESVRKEHR